MDLFRAARRNATPTGNRILDLVPTICRELRSPRPRELHQFSPGNPERPSRAHDAPLKVLREGLPEGPSRAHHGPVKVVRDFREKTGAIPAAEGTSTRGKWLGLDRVYDFQ